MRKDFKIYLVIVLLTLNLICSLSSVGSANASEGLQSTGKIVVTNPETGSEEVIFDANDQVKLKDNINANSLDINDLKEFAEEQNEINNSLRDIDTELKIDVDIINDSLGGFTPIIDETSGEITGYKTNIGGADTVFPFKQGIYITGFRCYQSMNIEFDVTGYSTVIFDYDSRQNNHAEKIYLDGTLVHTIDGKDATIDLNGASTLKIVGSGGGSSYTIFNSVTIE